MKKCPLPVLIVAIALMLAGIVGFFYHLKEFADPDQKLYDRIGGAIKDHSYCKRPSLVAGQQRGKMVVNCLGAAACSNQCLQFGG